MFNPKLLALGLIIFLSSCRLPTGVETEAPIVADPYNDPELSAVSSAQNIQFFIAHKALNGSFGKVSIQSDAFTAEDSMRKFSKNIAHEFMLYPKGTLNRMGVNKVVFVQHLVTDGQVRLAAPVFSQNTMVYDVELQQYPAEIPHIFHHELYHMADFTFHRDIYTDRSWEALNAPGFHYGRGGAEMREAGVGMWSTDNPGFLNKYSTSGLEEDKAEIYSGLLWNPRELAHRSQSDRVLAVKVYRIKQMMGQLIPEFNSYFWNQVQASREDIRILEKDF